MDTKDFCSEISVIPQYIGTCWFNAILINSFYSQAMRKLMIKKVSKLLTGSQEDTIVPFPTYRCADCHHVNEEFKIFE